MNLLDPANQNLPKITPEATAGNATVIIKPVFSDEKNGLKKGEIEDRIQKSQLIRRIGVGKKADWDARNIRRFFGSAYLNAVAMKPKKIALHCDPKWLTWATVGIQVAALNPALLKPSHKASPMPDVALVDKNLKGEGAKKAEASIKSGVILAEGKNLVRILGAMPPNVLTPENYAQVTMNLAKKWKVKAEIIQGKKLEKYQLINAVSQGSGNSSIVILFTLHPKKGKTAKATAVIGKGLCYDSGGLIGKQDQMKSMKEDMAGSANVLATVMQVAKGNLELKETTHFVMGLAMNMMGNNAMRADDIYLAGDGQSVEIAHTDAEGRLVLADCICYIKNHHKNVDKFVTIATLTGSCMRAFGDVYTGLVCNDEKTADTMVKAGKESGDYVAAAPWNLEYDEMIQSPIADVSNLSADPNAGWITAGLFLHRFIPKDKDGEPTAALAHLDIAGSIDMYEKGKPWRKKGFNSGTGVSVLKEFLTS